jgi:hypothetical protein
MDCSIPWTSYITAIVLPFIALVGAWIAFRQSEIAGNKLKFDLFDKRYEIFMHTWTYLSNIVHNGPEPKSEKSKSFEIFKNFRNNIPQAGFLFGSDIEKYLDELHENHMELWSLQINYDEKGLKQEEIERKAALTIWFVNEARDVKRRFDPYLSFQKWH